MGKEERERGERAREKAFLCARLVDAYKAQRVVILEVGKMCAFADYFVICHGQSTRQVQGIAHHLEEEMKKAGYRPFGVEGWKEGTWILLDYGEVIVHIFHDPVRSAYDLESLWADAPTL